MSAGKRRGLDLVRIAFTFGYVWMAAAHGATDEAAASAPAADGRPTSMPSTSLTASPVSVLDIEPVAVSAGDSALVIVPLAILPGFHVQANPASNPFLIPLTLGVDKETSGLAVRPLYPPPVMFRLEGTTEDLWTYQDSVRIPVWIAASSDASPGLTSLTAEIRFQACNEGRCLIPAGVPVRIPILILENRNLDPALFPGEPAVAGGP